MLRISSMMLLFVFFYIGCCPNASQERLEDSLSEFIGKTHYGRTTEANGTSTEFEIRIVYKQVKVTSIPSFVRTAYANGCASITRRVKGSFKTTSGKRIDVELSGSILYAGYDFLIFLNSVEGSTPVYSIDLEIDENGNFLDGSYLQWDENRENVTMRGKITSLSHQKP